MTVLYASGIGQGVRGSLRSKKRVQDSFRFVFDGQGLKLFVSGGNNGTQSLEIRHQEIFLILGQTKVPCPLVHSLRDLDLDVAGLTNDPRITIGNVFLFTIAIDKELFFLPRIRFEGLGDSKQGLDGGGRVRDDRKA